MLAGQGFWVQMPVSILSPIPAGAAVHAKRALLSATLGVVSCMILFIRKIAMLNADRCCIHYAAVAALLFCYFHTISDYCAWNILCCCDVT